MKKITIIAPLLSGTKNLQKLSEQVAELARDKYQYSVICAICDDAQLDFDHFVFQKVKETETFENCVTKGFETADGDAVLVLDPNQPNAFLIAEQMLEKWQNGADIVLAKRAKRPNFFERIYLWMLKLSKLDIDFLANKNFGLYAKDVAQIIKSFPNKNYYLRNFNCWVDYKTDFVGCDCKKTKSTVPVFNQYMILFLCSIFLFALSTTLVCVFSSKVPAQNSSMFVLSGLLVVLPSLTFGLYNLYIWLLRRKTRLDL